MKPGTHCRAVQVGRQNDWGDVGLVQDSLEETLSGARAGVPLQELWVSGKPISPAATTDTSLRREWSDLS